MTESFDGGSFTEVSHESWFSRIGGAIKGVLFGFALLIGSVVLLFWNESRSVKTYKALVEGTGAVVSVESVSIDNANDDALIHTSGEATTDEKLADDEFGVEVNAIKLKRRVEIYQWIERTETKEKKKLGGGVEKVTEYFYDAKWREGLASSSSYKDRTKQNPSSVRFQSRTKSAQDVTLGAFSLSKGLTGKLDRFDVIRLEQDAIPEALRNVVKPHNGGVYLGSNPGSPEIGDLRIQFSVVRPDTVSVVAKQNGEKLGPYTTSVGRNLEMLSYGDVTAEAMFDQAKSENAILTWILRGVGYLLMAFGFLLILAPLSVVADVIPILGSIVGGATGLISFVLALPISLTVIAVAWLVARPVLGITLLVLAIGGLFAILRARKNQAPERPKKPGRPPLPPLPN